MNVIQYQYRARIRKVIDGDTVDLTVDLGFHIALNIRIRLFGIDAPETNSPEGKLARNFLRELLSRDSAVAMHSYKDPTDKYGRWLASLTLPDGRDVADVLVKANHAVVKLY